MDLHDLQQLAQQAGVSDQVTQGIYGVGSAPQLVRAIQRAQGLEDCFRTDQRYLCKNGRCEWRDECLKLVARWQN